MLLQICFFLHLFPIGSSVTNRKNSQLYVFTWRDSFTKQSGKDERKEEKKERNMIERDPGVSFWNWLHSFPLRCIESLILKDYLMDNHEQPNQKKESSENLRKKTGFSFFCRSRFLSSSVTITPGCVIRLREEKIHLGRYSKSWSCCHHH